jgi:hypothetical protein
MSPTVFRLANIMAHIDASDRDQAGQATLPSGRMPLLSAMGRATPAIAFLLDELLVRDASLPLPARRIVTRRSLGLATEGKSSLSAA